MGISRPHPSAHRTVGAPPEDGPPTDTAGLAGALAARARQPRSPERQRRRRLLLAGIAVAVAVVVVAVALVDGARLLGLAPKGTPGPANAPVSYYADLGSALATARASYWSWPGNGQPALVFAEGLASPTSLGPAVNVSHLGAVACAPTLISSPQGSVPADPSPAASGLAPVWLYAFQATGNALVVVLVANGSASIVATTPTNGACYNGPGSFTTVPVDSSIASGAAAATPQSKRFFSNATANSTAVSAEYFLAPPDYLKTTPAGVDPVWILTDTSCPLYGGQAVPGSVLTTVVNAASGALQNQTTASVTC